MSNSINMSAGQLVTVWLAIAIVFALLMGTGAGYLAYLSGDKIPTAILKGCGAFAATLTLEILVMGLLGVRLSSDSQRAGRATTRPAARVFGHVHGASNQMSSNRHYQRTHTDDRSQVRQATALAARTAIWLRDEEATSSDPVRCSSRTADVNSPGCPCM
jgi:hypothetical protein